MRDTLVCFCLVHLQLCADVATYVHVGNVNGQNFIRRTAVKTLGKHGFADHVRVFQHFFVRFGRADGSYDTFAHARDDCFFACAADKTGNVGTHRYTRLYAQFDTVFGYGGNYRGFDDLRVDGHSNGIEYVAACKVDCLCRLQTEVDVCAVRRNKGIYDVADVTACHYVAFQFRNVDVKSCFFCANVHVYKLFVLNAAHLHTDKTSHTDVSVTYRGNEVCADRQKQHKYKQKYNSNNRYGNCRGCACTDRQ